MSEPVRFLTALSHALSTLGLYGDDHPAVRRAADAAYRELADLQRERPALIFTFLPDEVMFGRDLLPELERWEWSGRLAQGGIERLEITGAVSEPQFERFLAHAAAILGLAGDVRSELWQDGPEGIRFGRVRLGEADRATVRSQPLPVATLAYSLREERDAVAWVHQEVGAGQSIPLLEAYGVVRSLSLAMHGGQAMVMPLLQLKEFDQYTTTHSMNVSVLTMALGEFLGMVPTSVRAYGMAGLPPWWRTSTTAATTAAAILTSITPASHTRPAASCTSATSTTRSAPAGPTATPGPRPRRSTTSTSDPGRSSIPRWPRRSPR